MIGDAVSLMKGKKKPLLICGGGVKYSGAGETLKNFAEKFQYSDCRNTSRGKALYCRNIL